MNQRLVEALVGILKLDVFADYADGDRFAGAAHAVDERVPLPQVRVTERQSEYVDDQLVESLMIENEWDFVDRFDVGRVDHGLLRDVAEERNLGLNLGGQFAVAAAEQDVGLNSDGQQLLDRMLRRFGLQLARSGDEGHQRQMDEGGVVASDLIAHLADGFEEGKRFDVAHRAADLDDHHVHSVRNGLDRVLDLVRDVRDHLDGLAQVIAAALFLDYG